MVAVQLDFKGGTLDQYDEIVEKMGFTPGGAGPPNSHFHWVTATDDGFRVVDVWDNQEQFQKFAEEKIGPTGQEVGLPNPPEVTFFEVHNHFTAG